MDVRISTACTLCGLALLVSSGCQTYHPYGTQYGYPPGAYGSPQPGYINPGGGQIQPGGTPTPADSNLGQPGTIGNGGPSAPKPGPTTMNNGNNGGIGGRLPSEEPVPLPKEARNTGISARPTGVSTEVTSPPMSETTPFPGSTSPTPMGSAPPPGTAPAPMGTAPAPMGTAPAPMGTTPMGAPAPGGNPDPIGNPFGDPNASRNSADGNLKLIGNEQPFKATEPGRFQPPTDSKPLDNTTPSTGTAPPPESGTPNNNSTSALNPYDYDSKDYTWLRGKVDFDKETKTWQIIYAPKPDLADRFGGSFVLVDDPKLKGLRDHDIVLLEGSPDLVAGGKPRYKIQQMFGPLVPKAQLKSSPSVSPEFPGTGRTSVVTNQ